MNRIFMSAGVMVFALGFGVAAFAQSGNIISVTSPDGKTAIKGELLEIEGTIYKIKTSLGVFEVDATTVDCTGEGCIELEAFGESLAIVGSNAIGAELMPALILGYADSLNAEISYEAGANENERALRLVHETGKEMVKIDLATHGSSASFTYLAGNLATIGMSSRKIAQDEAAMLLQAGIPDPRETEREHVLALDAVAIIVHPDNPLTSISMADLRAVFAGRITSWAALGGPDEPINLYAGDEDSRAFDIFKQKVLNSVGQSLPGLTKRFKSNSDLLDSVSVDRNAIGFTGLSYVRDAKVLSIRQECGIVSDASLFSVKAEEYPLAQRLYLYEHPGEIAEHARRLLDYASSESAQPVISAAHLVNRTPGYRPLTDMGAQLVQSLTGEYEFSLGLFRELVAQLGEGRRLSTTFRFTPGSVRLDLLSDRSAAALARQLADGTFAGQEIVLVGFSDAIGEFAQNLALSKSRAQAVYETMINAVGAAALNDLTLLVQGYGELLPVACNTTSKGREINRRVEIWVRPKRS